MKQSTNLILTSNQLLSLALLVHYYL